MTAILPSDEMSRHVDQEPVNASLNSESPLYLVVRSADEPHLGVTYIKDGHGVLKKDISQNVRPSTATGDTRHAEARQRVNYVLVD